MSVSTEPFFADVEHVITEFSEADRPRARLLLVELDAVAARVPRVADRCYAYQARLYLKLAEYEQALIVVEKALLLMPLDDDLLILRGDIFREAAEYSRALHEYTRIIAANPDSVTARIHRAEMHHAQGEHSRALADLDEALRREPRSLRLIYRRALVLSDMGRLVDAIYDFQTVARLSPDSELRRRALQRLRELGERE